jgi:hypothetical protein
MATMSAAALVVQAVLVLPALAIEPIPEPPGPIRVVRDLEAIDIGVARPLGLAYLPGRSLIVVGDSAAGGPASTLVKLDDGSAAPATADAALDTVNLTADPASDRILAFDAARGELIDASADRSARNADPLRRQVLPAGPRPDAAGSAIDPRTGALLILDGRSRAIVRIGRGEAGEALPPFAGPVTTLPLSIPTGRLRGLARGARSDHLRGDDQHGARSRRCPIVGT